MGWVSDADNEGGQSGVFYELGFYADTFVVSSAFSPRAPFARGAVEQLTPRIDL